MRREKAPDTGNRTVYGTGFHPREGSWGSLLSRARKLSSLKGLPSDTTERISAASAEPMRCFESSPPNPSPASRCSVSLVWGGVFVSSCLSTTSRINLLTRGTCSLMEGTSPFIFLQLKHSALSRQGNLRAVLPFLWPRSGPPPQVRRQSGFR